MMPSKLKNRFVLLGIVLTWTVGGVVGLMGYRQLVHAVRHEAMARVENAVRVGQRVLENEFAHLDPAAPTPPGVLFLNLSPEEADGTGPLAVLVREARAEGRAEGFALLPQGLSMVVVGRGGDGVYAAAALPLRDTHRLPDQIRETVFGPEAGARRSATVTIFEGDVRIATNVTLADGTRATGTRASEDVAHRVLREGRVWNDRAYVVDRWMITCYQPIRGADGSVLGMLYAGLDEAPYVAQQERDILLSALSVLGLTLVVSVGGWYLGIRLVRPLGQLTQAAAALARGERERIETSSRDPEEVSVLAATFNRMSDEIHAKTDALEASRERAQRALDDYLEVLGFVSHELKSPVGSALTQLDVIEGGAEEVLSQAISDCAAEADLRKMSIRTETDRVPVWCDSDLMRVVITNLIGNAVKYGEEGTEVQVTARRTGDAMRLEVTNQGVGVPPERMSELFTKFKRIQDPQLSSRRGTGVGLYLVRRIVELHGGRVGAEGEYGHWIRFWFEIPAHRDA